MRVWVAILALWVAILSGIVLTRECRWNQLEKKADQGYVKVGDHEAWRMKRMMNFGMGEEKIAVYQRSE